MRRLVITLLCIATAAVVFGQRTSHAAQVIEADVVIYGGTSGGVVAAIAASRAGKSVAIVEPGQHLGGMTAGGLSWTDIGRQSDYIRALGGIAREVYARIGAHYKMKPGTEFDVPKSDDPTRTGLDFPKPPSLSFEPKVAEAVFNELQKASGAKVYFGAPLARVLKDGARIRELETTTGDRFRGQVFIDATYEGDLLAAAGVSYTVGREANSQYSETVNGTQGPATNPRAGKFAVDVSPFLVANKPERGLLPYLLQPGDLGPIGAADKRVQSYNYRVTLTDRPENRLPIEPPANYREADYELLARWIEARQRAGEKLTLRSFLKYDPLQNGKYDFNNRGAISTDFIGGADRYPEASPAERQTIAKQHEDYLRGFFTFLATSRRSPPAVRQEMSRFGLCRDEFTDNAGWPHQLYVREARRMIGAFVMTEHHATGNAKVPKPVALATYGTDMHAVRRIVHNGHPVGEGTNAVTVPQPFPIGYDALTPAPRECENLLVPFALSASHVAFGAIRMEPTFMMLSEAAGTAASLAIDANAPVQKVDYDQLRARLLKNGMVLEWKTTATHTPRPNAELTATTPPTREPAAHATKHPNVLMIIIDDVAANIHSVNQPSPVQTPAIARLAARSTWFTHAYNDAPACCPSRTAMLTGVTSSHSGVYYNTQSYTRSGTWIAGVESLPQNFLRHGYLTASYGKLYHSRDQKDHIAEFTPGYFKMHNDPRDVSNTDAAQLKQILPNTLHEIPGHTSRNWTWGILPNTWDRNDTTPALQPTASSLQPVSQDTQQANRTINFLSEKHDRPFFLACGFWRPHVPWTVAQRYYDMFPLDKIELPPGYKPGDVDDLPKPGRWIANHRGEHNEIVAANMWKKSLQGYYASLAYIDEQIGRVTSALDRSPHRDNTIVIFLSDNGMHLGEKDHWLKYALWEQTCQVLLSIHVPGNPQQKIDSPVSLLDLYPTLIDLCHLDVPKTHTLDGTSFAPLWLSTLQHPPVLSTYGRGNHAIRDANYRYIRYRNGDEELYDHRTDQYEWTNLAADPKYNQVKQRLKKYLPKTNAPDVPELSPASDDSRWQDEAFE